MLDERFNHDYTSVERFIDANGASSDIITIRNRAAKMAITLREVVAMLPPGYVEIRCCFCRSPQAFWQASAPNRQVTGSAKPGGGHY
jgi:hypothetical protein